VTGKLNVTAALKDARDFARKTATPQGDKISNLSDEEIARDAKQIRDARFTVDVGKADGMLRRIVADVATEHGDRVHLLIQLADVDTRVMIIAPTSGRPITQLIDKLELG
jgi:hypothetical protein